MCIATVLSCAYATTALGACFVFSVHSVNSSLICESSCVHQNGREVLGGCDTLAELLPMLIVVIISCAYVVYCTEQTLAKAGCMQTFCQCCIYATSASIQSALRPISQA